MAIAVVIQLASVRTHAGVDNSWIYLNMAPINDKTSTALVRPRPGFIGGPSRRKLAEPIGKIHFAHSGLSGFSTFEEAQYRGVIAAERVLRS